MSARPWYKRYGADFVHGSLGLTLEEKGAYSLCLDLIYDRGGPIPDDARWLAGVCSVSVRKWNAIRDRLVDKGKLTAEDGLLSNSRAEREIAISSETARKLAESGGKGGRNSRKNSVDVSENKGLAEAGLKHTRINQKPEEIIEEPNGSLSETSSDVMVKSRKKRAAYPPDFEAFWQAYPTDPNMSKKEALKAWKKLPEDEKQAAIASLPAFRAYCSSRIDYRPVHANRFISQERFIGFNQTAAKAAGRVFVPTGTPEWEAWRRVKAVSPVLSEEHHKMGWWFETQWPADRLDSAA